MSNKTKLFISAVLLITSLLLLLVIFSEKESPPGKEPVTNFESNFIGKVAIIQGEIKNRDFYPQTKRLKLTLPSFENSGSEYLCEIDENNRFRFEIYPITQREASIYPVSDLFVVGEGDSIFINVDFKDIQNPRYSGSKAGLNNSITKFSKSYQSRYVDAGRKGSALIDTLTKQRDSYFELLMEFSRKENPDEEFMNWARQSIETDYLLNLIESTIINEPGGVNLSERKEEYARNTQNADKIFSNNIVLKSYFNLTERLLTYRVYHGKAITGEELPYDTIFLKAPHDFQNRYLSEFIATAALHIDLSMNSTRFMNRYMEWLDEFLDDPFLRKISGINYNRVTAYNTNPKPLSDEMLGKNSDMKGLGVSGDNSAALKIINGLIESNPGKVIYIDFWAVWCIPCIENLKAGESVIHYFNEKDVLFVNICIMSGYEEWKRSNTGNHKQILNIYMNGPESDAVMRQFRFNSIPYGVLINREGYIVDFGTHVRASNPTLKENIIKVLENGRLN